MRGVAEARTAKGGREVCNVEVKRGEGRSAGKVLEKGLIDSGKRGREWGGPIIERGVRVFVKIVVYVSS